MASSSGSGTRAYTGHAAAKRLAAKFDTVSRTELPPTDDRFTVEVEGYISTAITNEAASDGFRVLTIWEDGTVHFRRIDPRYDDVSGGI